MERCAVDGVAISEEIPRRFIPGKRRDDLLRRPLSRGMFHRIEVCNATVLVSQNHEPEEQLVS